MKPPAHRGVRPIEPPQTISVIIPTYNRAALLREALASVLKQTYPPSEIVVADDGSTDDTAQVIAAFAAQGAPLKHLATPHTAHLGPLRNRGATAASGEWLAFLDSDDLWLPQRLERQIAVLGEAGAGFCNVRRFNAAGLYPEPWLPPNADYSGRPLGALFLEPVITASSLLVRRDLFFSLGGFGDRYNAVEYQFSLKLAATTRISYIPEPLVLLRQHEVQVSTSHGPRPLLEHLAIVRDFMRSNPALNRAESRLLRQGRANIHYKLAAYYLSQHRPRQARRHLRAQARLRPWERRIWTTLLKTYRGN